jgi:hypothetical protein
VAEAAAVTQEAPAKRPKQDEKKAKEIIARYAQLRSQLHQVEQVWRECYDFSYPLRGADFQQWGVGSKAPTDTNIGYGKSKQATLLDSTATDGCRILGSALQSGLTPANSRWFGLEVHDADEQGKTWLDGAADALWSNIHNSNYDATSFECMLDMAIAGMFALYVDEDRTRGGFYFEQWPISQCAFGASKPGGRIDTVYRAVSMTAEQAINEYGREFVSDKIIEAAEKKPDMPFEIIHAIYPRRMYVEGARLAKNLPWASCHIEKATNNVLRESGYHELPVIVPRWMLVPGSYLAVGPMFEALPDTKTLNKVKEFVLKNADVAIAGMWIAEDDGVLNPRSIKIGPRNVVVANSVESMKPLTPGTKFDVAQLIINDLQSAIRKVLMADQLTPDPRQADETATRVMVRVELIRQLLGPVYGRMQAEYLQPLVERCFGLAYRGGVFLPAPESLQDRDFTVKYLSPMARSQRAVDVAAMDNYELVLSQEMAIKQDLADVYDWDAAARLRSELKGVPQKLMVSSDQVKAIRDKRAQASQAAAAANVAGQAAAAATGAPPKGADIGAAMAQMAQAGAMAQ